VLQHFTVTGGDRGDSTTLQHLLQLVPGSAIEVRALQRHLRQLGTSDRYASVWLFPRGTRDSVSFQVTPTLAPARVVAVGAAYDNDLGGRIWLGQVDRHVLRSSLEVSTAAFLGELSQELLLGLRPSSSLGRAIIPTIGVRASRELVRRFDDGTELSPVKVHAATGFAGIQLTWRDSWVGSFGLEGQLWDSPGRGRSAAGPRLSILKAGRLAEPLFRLEAEANPRYRRLEIEGIASVQWGRLQVRPHVRYGWGESLPLQRRFVFGGVDGFAGRHIGELRSERELMGSLIFLHPVRGRLLFRLEPMIGAVGGGDDGVLPGGEAITGIRMGLNLSTGLGPIRVEYGFGDEGRDALLVRLGRWF
jgi:hypothetical protein